MSGAPEQPRAAGVVVAAGKGLRAGQALPKQFAPWQGRAVIRHSVEALIDAGVAPIIVVIPEGMQAMAADCLMGLEQVRFAIGAQTRQGSVLAGLAELEREAPERVLIHDAARPAVPATIVDRLCAALNDHAGAVPVLPVVDSLLHDEDGKMGEPAPRERLRRVQTPQAFRYPDILAAHRAWRDDPVAGDDAQVARQAGMEIALVEGDEAMRKLTFEADFVDAVPAVRVGTGYDVHRLESGEELWLCGVKIEHERGLAGHSDADVAIHALVDAMLGAAGAGDIGEHFPPGDPQWRDAASAQILSRAAKIVTKSGYRIGNADVTIICERPRIGPHRERMRQRLAEILDVDIGVLSVKATTTERLGFTGREEGIAAQAIVSLLRI